MSEGDDGLQSSGPNLGGVPLALPHDAVPGDGARETPANDEHRSSSGTGCELGQTPRSWASGSATFVGPVHRALIGFAIATKRVRAGR